MPSIYWLKLHININLSSRANSQMTYTHAINPKLQVTINTCMQMIGKSQKLM